MLGFIQRLVAFTVALGLVVMVEAAPRAEHVFIISIDGGSPPVIERSHMPVLKRLARTGAHTWHAQTIKPSITLPSHTSMLTGVPMAQHQVTWNHTSSSNGVVEVPTVFALAKQTGRSTAMFVGKEKFVHLLQTNTVDHFYYDRANDVVLMKSASGDRTVRKEGNIFARMVATNAADYIVKNKPHLCFIHFTDTDSIGHEFGWGSPEQIKAFAETDVALDLVLKAIRKAGIARRSVVLVTADHGGHGRGHSRSTPLDTQIPWIAWGAGVKRGYEIVVPVSTCDTAATALWLLGITPLPKMDGVPVTSAFK